MIRAVTVTNYLGESKRFELAFPEKSGFAVQSISGLGPSKADINTTEISTNDGSLYNSARVNSRNIVMSLKLMFTLVAGEGEGADRKTTTVACSSGAGTGLNRRELYTDGRCKCKR